MLTPCYFSLNRSALKTGAFLLTLLMTMSLSFAREPRYPRGPEAPVEDTVVKDEDPYAGVDEEEMLAYVLSFGRAFDKHWESTGGDARTEPLSELEQLRILGQMEPELERFLEEQGMPGDAFEKKPKVILSMIKEMVEVETVKKSFAFDAINAVVQPSPDGKLFTFTTEPQCKAYTGGMVCHKEAGRWYAGAPAGDPYAEVKVALEEARQRVSEAKTQDEKTAAQAELEKAGADMKDAIVAGKDVATVETLVEANAKALGEAVEEGASGSTETTGGASGDSSAGKATGQAGQLAEHALVLNTNAKRLTANEAVLRDHATRIEANRKAIADVAEALGEQREVIREQAGAINGNAQGIRENREGIDANTAAIRENAKSVTKNASALIKQDETLTTLEEALMEEGRAIDSQTEIVRSLTKADLVFNEKLSSLEATIREQEDTVREGLAMNAALSGLFKPYKVGHVNVTAALGGYKTEGALAVGTGYRVSNYVAMTLGLSTSLSRTSNLSSHLGVNINF